MADFREYIRVWYKYATSNINPETEDPIVLAGRDQKTSYTILFMKIINFEDALIILKEKIILRLTVNIEILI